MKRTSAYIWPTFLLAACAMATPGSRIAQNLELFNSWPLRIQAAVRAGEIGIGFTPDQVRMALGDPLDIQVGSNGGAASEIWVYQHGGSVLGNSAVGGSGYGGTVDQNTEGRNLFQLEENDDAGRLSNAMTSKRAHTYSGSIGYVVFTNGKAQTVVMAN